MEFVAAECQIGDTFGAAALWKRAAALDNVRAISVWEGVSLDAAHTRVFGPRPANSAVRYQCPRAGGGLAGLTAEEATALGISIDERYHCASCDTVGRLGDHVQGSVRWQDSSTPLVPPTAPLLVACAACRVALYCSKACQRTAWKEGHKQECPAMGAAALVRRAAAEESLKLALGAAPV